MNRSQVLLSIALLLAAGPAVAGQAPFAADAPDFPISGRDRVYAAEQFSNTVSVIDPSTNRNLGIIRLGDPQPMNLSPLYRGQVLVHGLGFSPDRATLAVVSIASNSVTFVDTATNRVKHTTYVGRSPHEAFFTQDGSEVWVTVRGEDYVALLDGNSYREKAWITVPNGPGMRLPSSASSRGGAYVLALAANPDGTGRVEPIAQFMTNPAGAQVVNAVGPIRQIVDPATSTPERLYLTILAFEDGKAGHPVQLQRPEPSTSGAR